MSKNYNSFFYCIHWLLLVWLNIRHWLLWMLQKRWCRHSAECTFSGMPVMTLFLSIIQKAFFWRHLDLWVKHCNIKKIVGTFLQNEEEGVGIRISTSGFSWQRCAFYGLFKPSDHSSIIRVYETGFIFKWSGHFPLTPKMGNWLLWILSECFLHATHKVISGL